jgi:hypothetical protein
LHEGRETASKQVGAYQEGHLLWRQFQGTAKNERYRNRSGVHDEHMLEAERQKLGNRKKLINRMNILLHKVGPAIICSPMRIKNCAILTWFGQQLAETKVPECQL